MLKYILLFVCSTVLGIFFTKRAMRLAVKADAVDKPAHRKVHKSIIPLWGGLGIFAAFVTTILIYWVFSGIFDYAIRINNSYLGTRLFGLMLGGVLVIALGLVDDKWGLPPKLKLLGQVFVAIVVVYFDVRIPGFTIPFFGKYIQFYPVISVIFTLVWIVALMNSMNFIDGVDGLAGGIALIGCLAFFAVSCFKPPQAYIAGKVSYFVAVISIVLAGSILGFLRFNFNPARVFMGDGGSMFLGLMLASISVIGSFKGVTAITLFTPALILTIPIFDIIFAVYRRWKNQVPLSMADKKHVHHRLLALGLSQRQTVLILYAIAAVFAAIAVLAA